MDSITVLHTVSIKVIMTPAFREQMVGEARSTIVQLDSNLERLEEIQAGADASGLSDYEKTRLASEKARMTQQKQELEWRIKEAESVKDGAELFFRPMQCVVTLKPGDNFLDRAAAEVLLKDWEVVEIRGGLAGALQ